MAQLAHTRPRRAVADARSWEPGDRQDESGGLCFASTDWFDATVADDIYEARVLGIGGAPREDRMPKKPRAKQALKERVLRIQEIMADCTPMTSMEVQEQLGVSYSKTSHLLKSMVDMGMVDAERRGVRFWYTLREPPKGHVKTAPGSVDKEAMRTQNSAVGHFFREGIKAQDGRVIPMPMPQRPPAAPPQVTASNWHTVLQSVAWAEGRPVEDVVADMLDAYREGR